MAEALKSRRHVEIGDFYSISDDASRHSKGESSGPLALQYNFQRPIGALGHLSRWCGPSVQHVYQDVNNPGLQVM
jgi:hypothetical protein